MIDVTCAIIRNDEGMVLSVRRGPGMDNAGKWEFPGGKIRANETDEDCIIREIREELSIEIIIGRKLDEVVHDYGNKAIRLIPFICDTLASKPCLIEHDAYKWMAPDKLVTLDLTAADIPVAVQYASMFRTVTGPGEDPAETAVVAEAGEEMAKVIGRITSTTEVNMVARSAVTDNVLLSQLVTLSSSHEKRVGFMASWALSKVADINIKVLQPFLPALITALPAVANDSVQRSFMRIIMKSDFKSIPENHHASLINYCMEIMRSEQQAVAPKAYGMEILSKMAVIYPEMANEIVIAIQMAITEGSPGIKAMGRKSISRLTSLSSS